MISAAEIYNFALLLCKIIKKLHYLVQNSYNSFQTTNQILHAVAVSSARWIVRLGDDHSSIK